MGGDAPRAMRAHKIAKTRHAGSSRCGLLQQAFLRLRKSKADVEQGPPAGGSDSPVGFARPWRWVTKVKPDARDS